MSFDDSDFPSKKASRKTNKKKKRTNTTVFFNIFQDIIQNFQNNPSTKMIITNIAKENNVQSRPIYDFFNLLVYFGVCEKKGGGRIGWVGFSKMYEHFEKCYIDVEMQSVHCSMAKIFITEDSPTLGFLASKIVSLYLYLGVDHLNLKDIAKLLNNCDYKTQSFERRVSLVLHMLAVFGIVAQTSHLREYRILIDIKQYDDLAFSKRLELFEKTPENYPFCYLNKFEESFIKNIKEQRQIEYRNLLKEQAQNQVQLQTQPQTPQLPQNDQIITQAQYARPLMIAYPKDPCFELPEAMNMEILS